MRSTDPLAERLVADLVAAVPRAVERLRGRVLITPVRRSAWLSEACGQDVWLKLENVQVTGSFKVRGATHKLLALSPEERARGVVAASSGNHGLGVAHAALGLGCRAAVVMPQTAPVARRERIAALGAEVIVHGDDCVLAESHARALAARSGRAYVSPYNDPDVVAGQGTLGAELAEQVPGLGGVYVALGGGGLVSGVAAGLRGAGVRAAVVAISPSASPAMAECVRAGAVIDVPCGPTLSDSTAGGVEPSAITLPLCQALVDRHVRIDEPAIAAALVDCLEHERLLVEGAAALAVAGLLADRARPRGPLAVILCGGNLSLPVLRDLLTRA